MGHCSCSFLLVSLSRYSALAKRSLLPASITEAEGAAGSPVGAGLSSAAFETPGQAKAANTNAEKILRAARMRRVKRMPVLPERPNAERRRALSIRGLLTALCRATYVIPYHSKARHSIPIGERRKVLRTGPRRPLR